VKLSAPLLGAKLGVLVAIILAVLLPLIAAPTDIGGRSYTLGERFYGSLLAALIMVIPSVIAGALIGYLARRLRLPPWSRCVVIAGIACLIVLGLAALTGLYVYLRGACVPVVVAALYLEHRTRTSAPIPIAIASQVR
jgi:hypothetical protein